MAKLFVYYPRHEGCGFDRDYYLSKHAPIVQAAWGSAGLQGIAIDWPFDESQPFACLATLEFESQTAIDAALSSAATPDVLADVVNFTDIQPVIYRAT